MAATVSRYTGAQVAITFGGATGHFQSIDIEIVNDTGFASAASATVKQRFSAHDDAKITLKGWDVGPTGDSTGMSFAALATLALAKTAPSALSWTDTGGTPASRLPSDFFTRFPLAQMKIVNPKGGSGDASKASEWTCDIEVNFIDVATGA